MKAISKAIVVAFGLSFSLLGTDCAPGADLPVPGGASIPPNSYYPASQPVNWGGLYLGVNGGYGIGRSDWIDALGTTGLFAVNGPVVGGTAGINYAGFGDRLLVGIEGDFDWSGATGSTGCAALGGAAVTCQTRIDLLSTFRLRVGYTWSHFLFFATGGGAGGDFRLKELTSGASFSPVMQLGWTAGAGVEYAFNDAVSAKVEYLYINLGRVGCPAGTVCSADNPLVADGTASFTENLVRAGVNYKFSW
jgi:outer membrane immunogenic protein